MATSPTLSLRALTPRPSSPPPTSVAVGVPASGQGDSKHALATALSRRGGGKRPRDESDDAYETRLAERRVEAQATTLDQALEYLKAALDPNSRRHAQDMGQNVRSLYLPAKAKEELVKRWQLECTRDANVATAADAFMRGFCHYAHEALALLLATSDVTSSRVFKEICETGIRVYWPFGASHPELGLLEQPVLFSSSSSATTGSQAHESRPVAERLRDACQVVANRLVGPGLTKAAAQKFLRAIRDRPFQIGAHRILFEEVVRLLPVRSWDEDDLFKIKIPSCPGLSSHASELQYSHLWFRLALLMELQGWRESTRRESDTLSTHEIGTRLVQAMCPDSTDEDFWTEAGFVLGPVIHSHSELNDSRRHKGSEDPISGVLEILDGIVAGRAQASSAAVATKASEPDVKSVSTGAEATHAFTGNLEGFFEGLGQIDRDLRKLVAAMAFSAFFRSVGSAEEMQTLLSTNVPGHDPYGRDLEEVRVFHGLGPRTGNHQRLLTDRLRTAWFVRALEKIGSRTSMDELNYFVNSVFQHGASDEAIGHTSHALLQIQSGPTLVAVCKHVFVQLSSSSRLRSDAVGRLLRVWPQLASDARQKLFDALVAAGVTSGRKVLRATPVLVREMATPCKVSDPAGARERIEAFRASCRKAGVVLVQHTSEKDDVASVEEFLQDGLWQIDDEATRDAVADLLNPRPVETAASSDGPSPTLLLTAEEPI